MNTVLLTAGVVALMAAVIGGDLRAFHIEVPVLKDAGVRASLGVLGIAFLVAAVLLRADDTSGPGPSQARDVIQPPRDATKTPPDAGKATPDARRASYQRQVIATCKAMRKSGTRNTLGAPRPRVNERGSATSSLVYDGVTVISGEREKLKAITQRLLSLKPVPPSLRDKATRAVVAGRRYVSESRKILIAFAHALPPNPTLQEINHAAAPLRDGKDKATAQLEDALTQLAGRHCSLLSTWPAGSDSSSG
jgi:hypothetical protein